MQTKKKIVIVDDHPIVLEGLCNVLSQLEELNILSTFKTGSALLTYNGLRQVDLVLLDVFLPDMNGIDLCLKLKKLYPKIIVLAMSSQSERSIVMQMIQNGANGYLLKSASLLEFKHCITDAISGKIAFSNDVKVIVDKTEIHDLRVIPRLTNREKEILVLLQQGKSTQAIADELFLSFLTVQTHRRNLLSKFQVKNLVELLNFVKQNALI